MYGVDSVAGGHHFNNFVLCHLNGVDATSPLVGVEHSDMIRQREYFLGGVTDSRYTILFESRFDSHINLPWVKVVENVLELLPSKGTVQPRRSRNYRACVLFQRLH